MLSFYHVGLTVPELTAAMDSLGDVLGLAWRGVREEELSALDQYDEVQIFTTRRTYSVGGPPAIEVLEQLPGTPFAAEPGSVVHHLGFWSEELAADSDRLTEQGWPRVGTSAAGGGRSTRFALHRSPLGLLIELNDCTFDRPWVCDLFPKGSPHYRPDPPAQAK